MACEYRFLDQALEELQEITDYLISATGNERYASQLLDEMQSKLELACEAPSMYPLSRLPELRERGYRIILIGSYIALYLVEGDVILVAHVFHQRRDYARLV